MLVRQSLRNTWLFIVTTITLTRGDYDHPPVPGRASAARIAAVVASGSVVGLRDTGARTRSSGNGVSSPTIGPPVFHGAGSGLRLHEHPHERFEVDVVLGAAE